nr:unnamed protein product [Naegleria fowleri]
MSEVKSLYESSRVSSSSSTKEISITSTHTEDATCHIWDLKSGQVLNSLKRIRTNHGCITFIPEHLYLIASQSDKGRIFIYDIRREQPLFECPVAEKITSLVSYGVYCFGGGENGTVYIWNILSGKLLKIFNAHLKSITAMDVNSDFLVTGSLDTLIQVWNLADLLDIRNEGERQQSPIYSLSSHALSITSVQLSKSSHTKLITTSLDRTCKIWDLSSGIEICSIVYPSSVQCGSLSVNEQELFVGCSNGCVYQMSLYPHKPQYMDENEVNDENNLEDFDPLLSGGKMVVSELGSSSSGTKTLTLENDTSSDHSVSRGSKYSCYTFKAHSNSVTTLNLSKDGLILVSGSKDGKLISWDVRSRQPLITFKKHSISADNEITNCIIDTINMTQFSTFHNNEIIKTQQEQKQVRNTSTLSVKPFKKFVETQQSFLEVNLVSDNWNCLYSHPDFDLTLQNHLVSPLPALPSSIAHQSLHLVNYKPKKVSKGIQKKDAGYAKKVLQLTKRLADMEQLYNQQKTLNEQLTELLEEKSKDVNPPESNTKATPQKSGKGFFHRKFQ